MLSGSSSASTSASTSTSSSRRCLSSSLTLRIMSLACSKLCCAQSTSGAGIESAATPMRYHSSTFSSSSCSNCAARSRASLARDEPPSASPSPAHSISSFTVAMQKSVSGASSNSSGSALPAMSSITDRLRTSCFRCLTRPATCWMAIQASGRLLWLRRRDARVCRPSKDCGSRARAAPTCVSHSASAHSSKHRSVMYISAMLQCALATCFSITRLSASPSSSPS
mmetsp:Transcript_29270/g.64952  ORF Transcript_29270/g.64952 Transcript_29270/m.64952 type:complete len:225 (-) Transcript_29270:461-1135(-)